MCLTFDVPSCFQRTANANVSPARRTLPSPQDERRKTFIPLNCPKGKNLCESALGWVALIAGLLLLTACSATRERAANHPFHFGQDTFAYSNALIWHYDFDPATGKTTHRKQTPPADYKLHCFVVARSARQFFENAVFNPSAPVADEQSYRSAIEKVVHTNPRRALVEPVTIPGYSNLFSFSKAHQKLLKEECGGAWQSYFQRGHWRMIFPFSKGHQARTAKQLAERCKAGTLPLVHVVCFPSLRINHALLLFESRDTPTGLEFLAYDPNNADQPIVISFNRETGRFSMPRTNYFYGGRVDVYEIFHRWDY